MISKDAVLWRCLSVVALLSGLGAKHVSPNFEVEAPTDTIAEKVALTAEHSREELAVEWLGHKLPNWSKRCQIRVKVGQIGAGGATTFSFGGGHVFGWDMTVQGSLERILDSVIPHEVSHTIFACHFRRPLPRWADEGAATLSEEDSERRRQQKLAEEVMPSKRRIPLRELLQITEYPKNMQNVLTLYAEGFSLADYLVQKRGKRRFLAFMQDAHESNWDAAFQKHYDEENVEAIEQKWSQWVIAGSPSLRLPDGLLLAEVKSPQGLAAGKVPSIPEAKLNTVASVVRSQTPDATPSATPATDAKSHLLVSASTSGHSLTPRSERVTAPEPRRRRSSDASSITEGPFHNSLSQNEIPEAETLPAETLPVETEPRRPRGPHLSKPELRSLREPSK